MAAPMGRVAGLSCCRLFFVNTKFFKHVHSRHERLGARSFLCVNSRTFVRRACVQSPRTRTITHGRSVSEETAKSKSNLNDQPNGSPLDCNGGKEVTDVRIYGDSSGASESYRKRTEREVLSAPEDAPTTAKTLAVRIRKELIQKRKSKEESKSQSWQLSDESNDQSVVTKGTDVDSKGFRILRHQVQDLSRFQENTVASILYRSVIYNEGDLIAIDKPYGLPSHGGPGVVHSVDSLLPLLARRLRLATDNPRLHLVHRLDKETTGVMLLAKTEAMAQRLHRMFIRHQVGKKYWLVTVGVPDPMEGVIDMPLVEREVGGVRRMGIRPDIGAVYKNLGKLGKGRGTKAVTNFRVMSENGSAALVEVRPETGVKHQIRVHMALGMGCPVLGDHKYSHHNKLAPQRLPMDMLHRLGIRQAKVRTVPMHLHARELILPDFLDGRNLFISTRVPKFFETNMRRLKLKVP